MSRLIIAGLLSALAGCDRAGSYTLATHQVTNLVSRVGADVAEVLETENGWEMTVLSGPAYNFVDNVGLIESGEVDFAVSASDVTAEGASVRTVMQLYPDILVVLYSESLGNPRTLEELLRGRKVGVGPKELPYSEHMLNRIRDFGIDQAAFTPVFHPMDQIGLGTGEMDVLFTFAGTNPGDLVELIKAGNRFFSFDDPSLDGRGSRIDGYMMRHPNVQSFVLPKNTFGEYPTEPVLTISIPMTVITRRDMSESVVYDFVATVMENFTGLFGKNPVLGYLSQDFDATKLNFPMHAGALRYLSRDQPTFFERYAELTSLIITVLILIAGGLGSIQSLIKQRRKERIDFYYDQILGFVRRIPESHEEVEQALAEIAELKAKAIQKVQEESLAANESFSIFLDLLHYEVKRLEQRGDAFRKSSDGGVSTAAP